MRSAAASFPGDELEPGTKVGDYVITGRLGEGGMATVYSGTHPLIGKRVAVKVIRAELCRSADAVDRFVQEACAANEIGHPNLVDVFNFGSLPDGRCYFVMEWLQGRTLADILDTDGPLPVGAACRALLEICDGLAAAHELGIVHRDLKPQNVFFVDSGPGTTKVKLLDFGIAKLVGKREGTTPHTQPGLTMGTPDYISPEQARGRVVDARADVYSLGVLAFEMATGQLPFVADNAADMMAMHLHAAPRRPSAVNPLLPAAFDALLERMLAKDAAQRPSVQEVRVALTHILYPPPPSVEPEPARQSRLTPRAYMLGAAGLGVLCIALVSGGKPLLPAMIAFAATPIPPPRQPLDGKTVAVAVAATPAPPVVGGTLVIRPQPAGAKVLIDGVPVPVTDGRSRSVFTTSGTHTLKVTAPGHRSLEFDVVVEDGRWVVVPARLTRERRARTRVANVPDDLRVLDPWAKKR